MKTSITINFEEEFNRHPTVQETEGILQLFDSVVKFFKHIGAEVKANIDFKKEKEEV